MSRIEEITLLALCAATDNRRAFSRLVELHQDAVRRFLMNLTGGDAALVDDLAQETFIKAWLGVRQFKGLSGFRTWLIRIAVNEFVSYRRRQRPEPIDDTAMLDRCGAVEGGQGAVADSMDVAAAMATLPETERMVALLFYLEDISIKEICKITAMPDGTVKSHLSRARKHLQNFFKNDRL